MEIKPAGEHPLEEEAVQPVEKAVEQTKNNSGIGSAAARYWKITDKQSEGEWNV